MLGPGWNSGEFGSVDRKVRSLLYRGALLVAAIGLLAEAPAPSAPSDEAAQVFALTGSRTAPVQSYTSKLHLDFALRSFPYLKFHLEGRVEYKRPNLYSVHFDHVPWFGKGFENVKMDPLQPQTWPEHYEVASVSRDGDRTSLEMRDKVDGNVKHVHAEIDADGLRQVEWQYVNGGRIEVRVDPVVVSGVPVPQTEDAEIKLPAYHVVAHATFSDYKIVTDGKTGTDGATAR
jgi:hypothetical protein